MSNDGKTKERCPRSVHQHDQKQFEHHLPVCFANRCRLDPMTCAKIMGCFNQFSYMNKELTEQLVEYLLVKFETGEAVPLLKAADYAEILKYVARVQESAKSVELTYKIGEYLQSNIFKFDLSERTELGTVSKSRHSAHGAHSIQGSHERISKAYPNSSEKNASGRVGYWREYQGCRSRVLKFDELVFDKLEEIEDQIERLWIPRIRFGVHHKAERVFEEGREEHPLLLSSGSEESRR